MGPRRLFVTNSPKFKQYAVLELNSTRFTYRVESAGKLDAHREFPCLANFKDKFLLLLGGGQRAQRYSMETKEWVELPPLN